MEITPIPGQEDWPQHKRHEWAREEIRAIEEQIREEMLRKGRKPMGAKAHGLGVYPSRVALQMCGAISSTGACTTRVVHVANRGPIRNDGGSINPINISSTTSSVHIGMDSSYAWGYWESSAWHTDGDHDSNVHTAYYRILAWR